MARRILLGLLFAASLMAADVTGTWEFAVQTSQGGGNPMFTFKQDGEKLTGKYVGALGESQLTGTVKGDSIAFVFKADQVGTVEYTGTIESASKMKGTAKYGELGDATWTAAKK